MAGIVADGAQGGQGAGAAPQAPLTLDAVRQQFPQYGDMSDGQLLGALHQKYYSDMPMTDFAGKIGIDAPDAAKMVYGIDAGAPIEDVRAQIAKLSKGQRQGALESWADARAAQENEDHPIWNPLFDATDAFTKGTLIGQLSNQGNAAIGGALTGLGLGGANEDIGVGAKNAGYSENLALLQARDRAFHAEAPVTDTALRLAGGVAGGLGAARLAAARYLGPAGRAGAFAVGGPFAAAAPAATLPGRIVQGIGAGSVWGGAGGAGAADWTNPVQGMESTARGTMLGMGVGAFLPPALDAAIGLGRGLGAIPRIYGSPQMASDMILRNDIAGAGQTPAGLLQAAGDASAAGNFGPNSQARVPVNLADLMGTVGQRRLAGAVSADSSANAIAKDALQARQTGTQGLYDPSLASATPVADQQATFGQGQRLTDALARSMKIKIQDSAFQNENELTDAMNGAATPAYTAAYNGAQDFQQPLQAALDKWAATAEYLGPNNQTGQFIRAMIKPFTKGDAADRVAMGAPQDLRAFQASKEDLDDLWTTLSRGGSPAPNRASLVTQFTHDVLDAVHGGGEGARNLEAPPLNPLYGGARSQYAGTARTLDALQFGRDALKENAEALPEHIAALDRDQLQAARIGALATMKQRLARLAPTDDAAKIFNRPATAAALKAFMAPATKNYAPAEQFGTVLQHEMNMSTTRNMALFGSRTAPLQQDIGELSGLAKYFGMMTRQGGSWEQAVGSIAHDLIGKFQYRGSVARSLARSLVTEDPVAMKATLDRIGQLHGQDARNAAKSALYGLANRIAIGPLAALAGRSAAPQRRGAANALVANP